MKIRNDYVSNSSSCSFVINDPIAFKNKALEWSRNCAYELDHLTMYAMCKSGDKSFFQRTWEDDGWDYDGTCRFSINVDDFMSLDDETLEKIVSIEFMCDDYDQGNVFLLSVLKKALENSGIPVDSSDSEHSLLLEDDSDSSSHEFMANICKAAFN